MGHPADVIAACQGVLTSSLARERHNNRARGILVEIQSLGERLQSWPAEEVSTIHAALLNAVEEVENLLPHGRGHPAARLGGGHPAAPPTRPSSTSRQCWGRSPVTHTGGEWWLHDRHHGLGNAPGSDRGVKPPTVGDASMLPYTIKHTHD